MYLLGLIEGVLALVGLFYITKKTIECRENKEYIELDETEYQRIKHLINSNSNDIPPPYYSNNESNLDISNNDYNDHNTNINDNDNNQNESEREQLLSSNEHQV